MTPQDLTLGKIVPLTLDLKINALADLQFYQIRPKYDFNEDKTLITEGLDYAIDLATGEVGLVGDWWEDEDLWELANKNLILGFKGVPIGYADFEFTEMEPTSWLHKSTGPHSYPMTACPKFTKLAQKAMHELLTRGESYEPRIVYLLGYNLGGAWSHTPDGSEYDSWFDFVGIVHMSSLQVQYITVEGDND